MNDPMADIQNNPDWRNLPVDRVGIRNLKHPIFFADNVPSHFHLNTIENEAQPVVATFDMLVDLPKNLKGTHMSRFVEILNEQQVILSMRSFSQWLSLMVKRLHANYGFIQAQFPYFLKKTAPISQSTSLMNYDVSLKGILEKNQSQIFATVVVPVTSLCPCSKEISDYGAHNQRSHVTVTVHATQMFSLSEVILLVEKMASCELYALLKRADEKAVTERAYNNPKFVEDMVRDVATALDKISSIKGYKISSENFESIHNHSAFAEINRLHVSTEKEKIIQKQFDEACV